MTQSSQNDKKAKLANILKEEFEKRPEWDSIKQMAQDIGIGYSSLQKYMRDEVYPLSKNLKKIEQALGLDLQELETRPKGLDSFEESKYVGDKNMPPETPSIDIEVDDEEVIKKITSST